jgi:hypothetical protein
MFPHNALVELVEGALGSAREEHIFFAQSWAALMGYEFFIRFYYAANRRLRSTGYYPLPSGLIERILERSDGQHAVRLYVHYVDDKIRGDIVHNIYKASGSGVVAFLTERLAEPQHQFSAAQSLGFMGAMSAGGAIQALLKSENVRVRIMATKVLGRLRYIPAVPELIDILLHRGEIWPAADSLGRIGTSPAYHALGTCFDRTTDQRDREHVLRALLHRREAEGIKITKEILARSQEARSLIASAVGYPDFDEGLNELDELGPLLDDDELLGYIIDSARITLTKGKISDLEFSLRGVACFNLPAATDFLVEIALGQAPPLEEKEAIQRSTPAREAKRLLALRGHRRCQEEMIEEALERIMKDEFFGEWTVNRLARWSRPVVREALLERIEKGTHVLLALDLLRFFAEDQDQKLFERFEQHDDDEIADIAHVYLKNPARFESA